MIPVPSQESRRKTKEKTAVCGPDVWVPIPKWASVAPRPEDFQRARGGVCRKPEDVESASFRNSCEFRYEKASPIRLKYLPAACPLWGEDAGPSRGFMVSFVLWMARGNAALSCLLCPTSTDPRKTQKPAASEIDSWRFMRRRRSFMLSFVDHHRVGRRPD